MLCAVRARLRSGPAAPDDGPLTASPPFPRTHRTLLPPPPPPPLPPSRDMKPPRHAVYSLAAYLLPLLLFDFLWPRRQLPAAAPSFPRCPPTCVFARAHLRVCMQICDVMRMRIDRLLTNTRAHTHTHTHAHARLATTGYWRSSSWGWPSMISSSSGSTSPCIKFPPYLAQGTRSTTLTRP